MGGRVEIGEITGPDVDRAGAEADCAGIETIEVNESLKRAHDIARVVEASGLDRSGRLEPRRHRSCREETSCAARHCEARAHVVEQLSRRVAPAQPSPMTMVLLPGRCLEDQLGAEWVESRTWGPRLSAA